MRKYWAGRGKWGVAYLHFAGIFPNWIVQLHADTIGALFYMQSNETNGTFDAIITLYHHSRPDVR